MFSAVKQFIRHVVPAVIKPLHVLWNEMISFIFLVLGVMMAFSTWRNFKSGQNAGSPVLLLAGGGFALLLLWFGVASYLKARRISRS